MQTKTKLLVLCISFSILLFTACTKEKSLQLNKASTLANANTDKKNLVDNGIKNSIPTSSPDFDERIIEDRSGDFYNVQFFITTPYFTVKEWNFGNGTKSTMTYPRMVTYAPGNYFPSLTVTDPLGYEYKVTQNLDLR